MQKTRPRAGFFGFSSSAGRMRLRLGSDQAIPLRHTKKPAFAGSSHLTGHWQIGRGMIRRCAAHPSRGPLATCGRCAFPAPTASASGRTSGFSSGYPSPPYKKTRFRGFCSSDRSLPIRARDDSPLRGSPLEGAARDQWSLRVPCADCVGFWSNLRVLIRLSLSAIQKNPLSRVP